MNFSISEFCSNTAGILQMLGWVLTIVKIAIPLIIVIYGIMDLAKAVVASKEDEIKTGAKRLMWRAVAGICIFFIPSIVMWLFGTITTYNTGANGFDTCKNCILTPWSCTTTNMQY